MLRIDRYYDLTCDECGRSRSTDFFCGMEQDRKIILSLATREGWKVVNGKTLCPDCVVVKRSKPT